MLLNFLKSLVGSRSKKKPPSETARRIEALLAQADQAFETGLMEQSLELYKSVLEHDPYQVLAINQAAVCLSRLKRNGEAGAYFERAALLDDTFAPALVNFAIHLNECFQSADAARYLKRAQMIAPGNPHIDGALAAIQVLRGHPREANTQQLNGWLKSFDKNEFAHNYLFYRCFPSESTGEDIAAEHYFWAETVAHSNFFPQESEPALDPDVPNPGRKIRIGYLSSDFRKHSVRYFFRPLLENHDRQQFEVYGYHDIAWEDEQTRAIRTHCDVFRDIANQPDSEAIRIIRADRLDILVELAGHTSISRIHLFGNRLARLQLTAIGYPPTTGWSTIDYKVMDHHTAPPGSEHLYAERPMRLKESFWCFNPLEETPDPAPPPHMANDFITFGCFGNISKISRQVLGCWARIMGELPNSRLVLKAITFQDEDAKESIKKWLASAGIDLNRVRLVPPDPPEQLYSAYADVDIILDTFPFNGGTTSCFALWMGVPIVTLAGEALISRMGTSMLHTLGLEDLVATTDDQYIAAALNLAADRGRLVDIRHTLRERMLATPLGNGAMYARQFEAACLLALARKTNPEDPEQIAVSRPTVSEHELIRRTEFVLRFGQTDAAQRITEYCLRHYPESVGARILRGDVFERQGLYAEAHTYLSQALSIVARGGERRGLEINLLRLELLLGQYETVQSKASALLDLDLDDLGHIYVSLYRIAAQSWTQTALAVEPQPTPSFDLPRLSVIIHCQDDTQFLAMEARLAKVLQDGHWEIIRAMGDSRIGAYEDAVLRATAEIVLFVRSETEILNPRFHEELASGFECCDVIGFAGADRLAGLRWFDAGFQNTHGACVLPANEHAGGYNLCVYGPSRQGLRENIALLDGALFAAKKSIFTQVPFDRELDGDHGLCEMDWSCRASSAGFKIGVVPLLAVAQHTNLDHIGRNWIDCAAYFREKHNLPENADETPPAGASISLPSVAAALPVILGYYDKRVQRDD